MKSIPDHEAILGSYFRAEGPLTVEELHATYSRINPRRLDRAAAMLEKLGYIEAVSEGGHMITPKGVTHWREDD